MSQHVKVKHIVQLEETYYEPPEFITYTTLSSKPRTSQSVTVTTETESRRPTPRTKPLASECIISQGNVNLFPRGGRKRRSPGVIEIDKRADWFERHRL